MSEEIGKRFGDYQILNELGRGGMGRVYRVRNVLSERIEAMKVLLPDVATQQDLAARFLREIKLLASLNHPNIAALRTALTVDNQLVMIMEYVEGTTLAELLEKGPVPVPDALNYIDQVLNALSYAHRQNVIHRDIKPANIILTPQGVIKLMDFGIARSSGDERSLTMTGTTLGSLNYMSPEQVKGEATDARSDLYSLGISLYELVTGQRPFHAHSDYSIMVAQVKEMPKPPIELDPGLPPALNEIILMSIAKDPAQRFQTADAFRNALSNVHVAPMAAVPSVPAVSPDAAVTAALAAPAIAPTTQPAAPERTPSAARVTPIPPPTALPVPPPPPPRTHRGLYMTLGALIVLAALVAAGIYVPRRSKTLATTSPSQTQPAAAQPAPVAPAPVTPAPEPASTAATPPQSVAAETPSGVQGSGTPPAVSMPSQPRNPDHPGVGARKAVSEPVVNAALKEAESRGQSNAAAGAPADNAASSASRSEANGAANLDELEREVDQLSNRAAAIDASLDRLQQEQNNAGYGLRGDIVARRASMRTSLSRADNAVQQGDAARAKRYLGLAQGDVEALEHFLGR